MACGLWLQSCLKVFCQSSMELFQLKSHLKFCWQTFEPNLVNKPNLFIQKSRFAKFPFYPVNNNIYIPLSILYFPLLQSHPSRSLSFIHSFISINSFSILILSTLIYILYLFFCQNVITS